MIGEGRQELKQGHFMIKVKRQIFKKKRHTGFRPCVYGSQLQQNSRVVFIDGEYNRPFIGS